MLGKPNSKKVEAGSFSAGSYDTLGVEQAGEEPTGSSYSLFQPVETGSSYKDALLGKGVFPSIMYLKTMKVYKVHNFETYCLFSYTYTNTTPLQYTFICIIKDIFLSKMHHVEVNARFTNQVSNKDNSELYP